jgi:Protein of unknown function (DUF1573)
MKKIATTFALALFAGLSTFAQTPVVSPDPNATGVVATPPAAPALPITTVAFSETVYNFGTIEQGTPVTHKFIVTNTGTEDLVISEVKRTCGCTNLEWSKEPIKPNASGWVDATFNAASPGNFSKTIFFNANVDPNPVGLTFQGEVKAKEVLNLNGGTMMDAPGAGGTMPAGHSEGDGHNHPH